MHSFACYGCHFTALRLHSGIHGISPGLNNMPPASYLHRRCRCRPLQIPPFRQKEPPQRGGSFCLWATKKIFLLVLRMNSNPCINEILADARVKSANADEIFGFASDEIKSTHSPSRQISPNEVGFHRSRRFHPPARVDLVEKSTDKVDAFCL